MKNTFAIFLLVGDLLAQQDGLDHALNVLRATPYRVPEARRAVELGGRAEAQAIMENALKRASRPPEQGGVLNEASLIAFAILSSLDNQHLEAIEYLSGRVKEVASLAAPPMFSPAMVEVHRINQYAQDILFLAAAGHGKSVDLIASVLKSDQYVLILSAIQALSQADTSGAGAEASLNAAERIAQTEEEKFILGFALVGYAERSPVFRSRLRSFLGNERLRSIEDETRRARGGGGRIAQ